MQRHWATRGKNEPSYHLLFYYLYFHAEGIEVWSQFPWVLLAKDYNVCTQAQIKTHTWASDWSDESLNEVPDNFDPNFSEITASRHDSVYWIAICYLK